MKRDMDLIRRILLGVESDELLSNNYGDRTLKDVPSDVYFYHVHLLDQAGYVRAISMKGDNYAMYYPAELTWNGHEFLDAIRDDTIWNKVKAQLGTKLSSVPLPIISGLGLAALKAHFGLS